MQTNIIMCTPDPRLPHAQATLDSLYETAGHLPWSLTVKNNAYNKDFSHPEELNSFMARYIQSIVVTIDDDVILPEGWLDAALEYMEQDDSVMVVGFNIENEKGKPRRPRFLGPEGFFFKKRMVYDRPIPVLSVCSCVWVMRNFASKAGWYNTFPTRYKKYAFEHIYAYGAWENAGMVVMLPHVVQHFAKSSAKVVQGEQFIHDAWHEDHVKFDSDWPAWRYKELNDRIKGWGMVPPDGR